MEQPASRLHTHGQSLFFPPVFKLAEDALPSQFTCEDPAASVPSSSNYIYVPFIILWALTVAAAEGLSAART